MLKSIWQWITRNTFNGRFHDFYADMTPEELQALIDQNKRDHEYMLNEHEDNLNSMDIELEHEEALMWNNMRNILTDEEWASLDKEN